MTTPFHLGLRNNRHMVRLMRTHQPRQAFRLARAYADNHEDSTAKRQRVLDDWGLQTQSPRRPEAPQVGELLSARAQRIYERQLHHHTQAILNQHQHGPEISRRDAIAGPKQRIHLGVDHVILKIESYTLAPKPLPKTK